MGVTVSMLQMRELKVCPVTQDRELWSFSQTLHSAFGASGQARELISSSLLSPVNVLPEEGLPISSSFYH